MLKRIREKKGEPVVVVDGGNLLSSKVLPRTGPGAVSAKIAAQGIVKSYNLMQYDGIGISSVDLSAGVDFFLNNLQTEIPWLSVNVLGPDGKFFFPPSTIIERAGIKIGIIGLTNIDKTEHSEFIIIPWQEPLRKSIDQIKNDCDLLILLASFPQSECKEVANHFPEINIIVTGDRRRGKTEPFIVKNSLITQSTSRGKYIGQLTIDWENGDSWLSRNHPKKKKLEHKLHFIEKKLKRLQGQTIRNNDNLETELAKLQTTKENLQSQIKDLDKKRQRALEHNPNSYSSAFLAVQPRHSPKEIEDIVDTIQNKINSFNKLVAKSNTAFDTTLRKLLTIDELAGPSTCIPCHEQQTTFWKTTSHAHSYQTLLEKGQAYNPACLVCHVNGGSITPDSAIHETIYLLSVSADQKSVSCEMCHGSGLAHATDPETVAPIRTPEEPFCLVCHTPDQDNNFNYEAKLSQIACPASE